jgi:hypothetical protein
MDNVETNPTDVEADTARWRSFLEENLDALLEGTPNRPEGWWDQEPGEDAIAWMFRVFPVVKLQ